MVKKIAFLSVLILLTSCINIGGLMLGANKKGRTGSGAQHYKYKCEKVGECCEIGKDCETEKSAKDSKDSKDK